MSEREAIAWLAAYVAGLLQDLQQRIAAHSDADATKAINRCIEIVREFKPDAEESP